VHDRVGNGRNEVPAEREGIEREGMRSVGAVVEGKYKFGGVRWGEGEGPVEVSYVGVVEEEGLFGL
jgi:hypothetical protein